MTRWDALFADLESQAAALARAERAAEVDERTRGEVGELRLADRLRAATGLPVRVQARGDVVVAGVLDRVGAGWLLVSEQPGREALIVTAAVVRVRGLPRFSAVSEGIVASRLGLRHALRGIARDRARCRLHLVDGSVIDATIDRVGHDFLDAATHGAGEVRRRQDVQDVSAVPLAALVTVRRAT